MPHRPRRLAGSPTLRRAPACRPTTTSATSYSARTAATRPIPPQRPISSQARRARRERTSTSGTAMHPLSQGIASSRTMQGALWCGETGTRRRRGSATTVATSYSAVGRRIWSPVPKPTGTYNIYLWDRDAAASESMRLVSHTPLSSPPTGGNGYSFDARISGNGRFVTFTTSSTDLGPDPVRGLVHELQPNPSGGASGPAPARFPATSDEHLHLGPGCADGDRESEESRFRTNARATSTMCTRTSRS